MLLALTVQVGLGLFASDEDGLYQGPLSYRVSPETADILSERHESWFYVLLALIVLHLAAIAYYVAVRRRPLLGPMVRGGRIAGQGERAMIPAPPWRLALAIALAAGGTLAIVTLL